MSKIVLTDLVNLQNETTAVNAINTNNAALEAAIENTLSRNGILPNQMDALLDMNSHRIINLPEPVSLNEPARLQDILDVEDGEVITIKTSYAGLNYLDFVPTLLVDGIVAGTDTTTDQAPYWTAFNAALVDLAQAGRVPHGVIPQCTIYTSTSPNFAINHLVLETHGLPKIIATSTNPGFLMDATAAPGGFGIYGCSVGSFMAGTTTGSKGIDIRYVHQSRFAPLYSMGGVDFGIYIEFAVSDVFDLLACSPSYIPGLLFLATPAIGIEITGNGANASGWSVFTQMIGEYCPIGIRLNNAHGCTVLGGVAESNTNYGMHITNSAFYNNIFGMDFEANTVGDVDCAGSYGTFTGINSVNLFKFSGTANVNTVNGGIFKNFTLGPNTKFNTVNDIMYASNPGGVLTDSGTHNRFHDCLNHQTEKYYLPDWTLYNPGVTSQTGATIATAALKYYQDGSVVKWSLIVNISSAGGGGGWLNVAMPFTIGIVDWAGAGIEIGHSGRGVTGYIVANGNTLQLRYSSDGSFPGDVNGNFIAISGTCQVAGF